jgi:hypothetical protein
MSSKLGRMRRFLLLCVISAFAVAGVGSGTAMADSGLEAVEMPGASPCGELSVSGNEVSGGCLSEGWSGSWRLYQFGTPVTSGCKNSFATRTAADGSFYAVNTYISGCSGIQRQACPGVPWPGEFHVAGIGAIEAELNMCVTSPSHPNDQTWIPIHYSVDAESGSSPFPMSMTGSGNLGGSLIEVKSDASIADAEMMLVEL